ncbi:MAG: ACT domain-containing protein [Clostridia bacterium]|nr:ACT domain-containing protein [Clostridia bacterium]
MAITQISVSWENKPGRLAELTDILSEHKINIRALSLADTKDFGILRIIVDDPDKTASILQEVECIFTVALVLAAAIPDEPGSLSRILHILAENDINLEYTYAFITRKEEYAYMILRVEDNETTSAVLTDHGFKLVSQEELFSL